jgi:hypothetical protein
MRREAQISARLSNLEGVGSLGFLSQSLGPVNGLNTYSIEGPTKSAPIRAPCRITLLAGRFIPAAKLQVATMTLSTPSS